MIVYVPRARFFWNGIFLVGLVWGCSGSPPAEPQGDSAENSGTDGHTGGTSDGVNSGSGGGLSTGGTLGSGGGLLGGGGVLAAGGVNSSSGGVGTDTGGAALASGGALGSGGDDDVFDPPFILGADISITLEDEASGATYTDGGVKKSLEEVLQDHGFNFVRVDTFVDPKAVGGYAANKSAAFRSLAQTIILGKRVKARGMGFLLDLHMSDTWTNPGAQGMPADFAGLSLAQLEVAVHDYVFGAVTALRDAGARPDMVQVGNEITNGFLWESGRVANNDFTGLGKLLKAGIAAVREVDPRIRVMLHIEKCNNLQTTRWWLDGVLGQGVDFDVFGQSCYAPALNTNGTVRHPGYQGSPADWKPVFAALVTEYPELDFVIAEYSSEQRSVNDVLFELPDGRGLGSFNWDPTRFYDTHPNVPLFSTGTKWNDYVAIPAMLSLYDQMAEDYGLR